MHHTSTALIALYKDGNANQPMNIQDFFDIEESFGAFSMAICYNYFEKKKKYKQLERVTLRTQLVYMGGRSYI